MRNKLTRLVLVTCFAFLGIISLQVYWLYNSYQEKCARLKSDLSVAILSTQLSLALKSEQEYQSPTISQKEDSLLQVLSYVGKISLDTSVNGADTLVNVIFPPTSERALAFSFNLNNDSKNRQQNHFLFSIETYQKELEQTLNGLGVNVPVEVAFLDKTGVVIKGSVEERTFKNIPFKSNLKLTPLILANDSIPVQVQVAVPNASHILLKQIWVVAFISTLLIVFSIASLTYMIALFFKQKKISEIRNDFTNNMTHELKTPISSVTVALGLLKDDSMDLPLAQKNEYFQIAENELQRLTLLVDKVLKMAAFEKGEIKLSRQTFLVKQWIESIVNPMKPVISSTNAKITITVYPDNLKIRADKTNMSSVLQNLLDNAIKYADREKDRLSIQIDAWQSETHYFLSVQDNGIGIPIYHQERIFDKFFRVPTGDEHETKGYGLGLSYVKEIILLHGGNIELESTFHTGTRFKISIPKNQS